MKSKTTQALVSGTRFGKFFVDGQWRVMRFLIYGVVRGAIANQNRLARQCEVGEVPIASELGDATFFMAESTRERIRLGLGGRVLVGHQLQEIDMVRRKERNGRFTGRS